ncbi:MAG: TolC family protein [Bacteroidota bacterium]
MVYGINNNISVQQADVQLRLSALEIKLREAGRLPNLNFASSAGYNFGRSINRATNTFESRTIFFNNFQVQSNVNLFNWFSQRHSIEAAKLSTKAAEATKDKARNDIALNVATAYLQALLANEQIEVARVQIAQTSSRLQNIIRQVTAGVLPELNAVELEVQLARDSAAYIGAGATYQQNLILLKALLNLDMKVEFDIEKPDVSTIPVEALADLQPEAVYAEALKNLPQQRVNEFRYQSAIKEIQVAKASMYPTLSAFGNVGSQYSSLFPDQQRTQSIPTGKQDTLGSFEITPGTTSYLVRPGFTFLIPNTTYGRQLFDVNLSQAVGLNLSIPIFNNRQLRTARDRAVLNAEGIKLQTAADNLQVQQDIYAAYNDAVTAQQQFFAAQKASEAADRSFGFSQKRFDAGLLSTLELLTNQNNLYRARLDALSAQYEFVFRMKLLEFYKGKGLKL